MLDLTARKPPQESLFPSSLVQAAATFTQQNQADFRPLVLVIEDHAATQNVLISVLTLHSYQVVCAANGQEALDWLHTALPKGQQPAIILLDLFMPVMNGADFLAGMRAEWPGSLQAPPVILFTVDQSNHDDLACTDVLLKPFHIRDLLAKFRLVLQ